MQQDPFFSRPGANAVIAMPPGTSYTETSRDGHTMVDITMNTNGMSAPPNIPNMGYITRPPMYVVPQYPIYPGAMNTNGMSAPPNIPNMGYITRPPMYTVPQYPIYPGAMYPQVPVVTSMPQPNPVYQIQHPPTQIPQQQQQQRSAPLPPRQKKILQFIDPNTGSNILADKSDAAKPAAPEPPKSESTSPAPASVSEVVRSSTDEVRHKFSQGVAAAFQQKMKISETPKQEQTPEPEKSVSKEPTPAADPVIIEEKVAEPEPETNVPEKEPTPLSTESGSRRSLSEGGERVDETPSITVQEPADAEVAEDEAEAADVATPQKEDKRTLLAEYEQKVLEFMQNPTNVQNIAKSVYTRDLIELLSQIIKVRFRSCFIWNSV